MKWLELAATDFSSALQKSKGVVLVPIGSIEIHGPHLPVGCDTLIVARLVEKVAECEPVVIAPVMAYTMAPVAKLHPGGISLPPELLVEHLQKVCDELARNGFNKIVLVHAHGGNVPMHQMTLATTLDRAKPYSLYSIPPLAGTSEVIAKLKESEEHGHACEVETSLALHLFPELCIMERVHGKVYQRQQNLDVGPAATPVDWAASYPHYAVGNASKASAEKGEKIMNAWVDTVVDIVRKVIELVKSLGANKVIDYTKEDFTKDEQKYDFVFDTVGKSSFLKCKHLLQPGGIYISSDLGYMAQNIFLPLITPIIKPMIGNKKTVFPIPTDIRGSILLIKELIEKGKFKTVIDREFPLEQIVEAYKYVEKGQKTGNVVINVEHNNKT